MAKAVAKLFKVSPKTQQVGAEVKPRIVRAERRAQVEAFLIAELNITEASQEDCIAAGRDGIPTESAISEGGSAA